ncbi:MAG TPA: UDP-N-acetylmuramate dehydrogenase [Acidimicrobiia bacterium]|nr:UDP-N-acetylmuramate dehydrogenase [Acidimicrobiia bacterium]
MNPLDPLVREGLLRVEVELAPLTTYKMGGRARWMLEAASESDVVRVLAELPDDVPVFVLGRGSNVVVSEHGFPGLVVRLGGTFLEWSVGDDGVVTAGGAVPLPVLARGTARLGRGGLEWYVGIPGSVGGAVCMNAGCFGGDTAGALVAARILDVRSVAVREADRAALDMAYRHTNVAADDLVLSARFRTEPVEPAVAEARIREITRWRKEHQPGGTLNAGSVFKNPPGDAAGRIIDEAGLKGLSVGGASVSERHANFFVAGPDARPSDVHGLVQEVRRRVLDVAGIDLEPEVRFIGAFEDRS